MRAAPPLPRPVDERSAMRYYSACTTGIEAYILNRPVTEYYPAAIPRSELDPILPGKVTGCCHDPDELAHWIGANVSGQAPVNRRPASDDLIAYHLQNARQPNAYTEMATAPPPWAKLLNKVSREHAPKKMQKRYIDEVDGLLPLINQLQMCETDCVPAMVDEVGIKLQ